MSTPVHLGRVAPAALALVAAAFALVVVFFAMVLARLVTMAADHLAVAALPDRAARALGLSP